MFVSGVRKRRENAIKPHGSQLRAICQPPLAARHFLSRPATADVRSSVLANPPCCAPTAAVAERPPKSRVRSGTNIVARRRGVKSCLIWPATRAADRAGRSRLTTGFGRAVVAGAPELPPCSAAGRSRLPCGFWRLPGVSWSGLGGVPGDMPAGAGSVRAEKVLQQAFSLAVFGRSGPLGTDLGAGEGPGLGYGPRGR